MPEDSQSTRRDKPEQGDKFIPPPMDPYATYQTPYERRQAPEPNPFIEFRRFADKQLSGIFSGFSNFAGFPKMFGMDDEMKNFREQLEKDFKDMVARRNAMEEHWKNLRNDTYRPIPASATAATSPVPSQNSDVPAKEVAPENKQKPNKEVVRDYITTTDDNGKKYRINLSTGHAVEEPPAALPTPKVQQPEDPKTRWRRGFRNCPELKKYQGETELDVYEALEDQQRSPKSTESSTEGKSSWPSWLSAYGYDGLQKSKKASEMTAARPRSQDDETSPRPCEVKTYRAGQTRRMDPLRNDHEFLPWIVLSPYSPLSLANPEWVNLKSATLHNGCVGGCSKDIHAYSHQFQDNQITEEDDKSRAALANKVSWADAFEDLISLERTGKMPDREVEGRVHPRKMTSNWVRDMIEKGLLGPKWWVEGGGIRRDSRDDPKTRPPIRRIRATPEEEDAFLENARRINADIDALLPNYIALLDQLVHSIANEDLHSHSGPSSPKESNPAAVSTPTESIHIPQPAAANINDSTNRSDSQTKNTITAQPPPTKAEVSPVPIQPEQQSTPAPVPALTPKMSVISTLTTMTSRTLPDGSVETKRVLKKRFADGKEESEESTEVVHPQAPQSTPDTKSSEQQKSQGWFWT